MPKTRGDMLSTDKGRLIGKQQIYALLVDSSRNPVLDANGNEQLVNLEVVAGKLQIQDAILAALLGTLDTAAVIDPAAASATQLSLLRGIIKQLQGDGTAGKAAPVSISGSLANQVTLQSNASITGNGTTYTPTSPMTLTFEIAGTSTSRTINFELAGPKGAYTAHPAIKVGDSTYTAVTSTTSGDDTTPASYEVDIPAGYSFRARISAIAGGDVDISGWAVAQ